MAFRIESLLIGCFGTPHIPKDYGTIEDCLCFQCGNRDYDKARIVPNFVVGYIFNFHFLGDCPMIGGGTKKQRIQAANRDTRRSARLDRVQTEYNHCMFDIGIRRA